MPQRPIDLAPRILDATLDELRREATALGHLDLLETLLPRLTDANASIADCPGYEPARVRQAFLTLSHRFRERVDAHLQRLEPDATRRRSLRRTLFAALREQGNADGLE